MSDKTADLAGPGIGNYADSEKILPDDYESLLTPRHPAGKHQCRGALLFCR